MYLNNFKLKLKKKFRVGRGIGSGLGKTCGKGHKGQRARSGYSYRNLFEGGQTPIHVRLPKFGFFSRRCRVLSLSSILLNKILENDINLDVLKKHKFINNCIKSVKIVYKGDLNRVVNLNGIKVTSKVEKNILSLGGSISF